MHLERFQKLRRKTGRIENQWKNRGHPDSSIVEIRPEYSEESWGPETCCQSDSSERSPVNCDGKNSKELK